MKKFLALSLSFAFVTGAAAVSFAADPAVTNAVSTANTLPNPADVSKGADSTVKPTTGKIHHKKSKTPKKTGTKKNKKKKKTSADDKAPSKD